jgi:2-phospho-L-lactate guanylyltransferase
VRTDRDQSFALVPIKPRCLCKSRLAGVLDEQQRLALVRSMLARVLEALGRCRCIGPIALVSAERDTVPPQIRLLHDAGAGLNAALHSARRTALSLGARAIVVLPADLPQVTSADIEALVYEGRESGFALAPDEADAGTNALYCSAAVLDGAATAPAFRFGADSRRCHQLEARRVGLTPRLVRRPGLAFDVDTPQDLARLLGSDERQLARQPQHA